MFLKDGYSLCFSPPVEAKPCAMNEDSTQPDPVCPRGGPPSVDSTECAIAILVLLSKYHPTSHHNHSGSVVQWV